MALEAINAIRTAQLRLIRALEEFPHVNIAVITLLAFAVKKLVWEAVMTLETAQSLQRLGVATSAEQNINLFWMFVLSGVVLASLGVAVVAFFHGMFHGMREYFRRREVEKIVSEKYKGDNLFFIEERIRERILSLITSKLSDEETQEIASDLDTLELEDLTEIEEVLTCL